MIDKFYALLQHDFPYIVVTYFAHYSVSLVAGNEAIFSNFQHFESEYYFLN